MTAAAIASISVAVVALTQLVKWAGLHDKYGPLAVIILSLFGVVFWGWSNELMTRRTAFEFFVGWITVTTSAAGVFGFTRASSEAVTRTSPPPVGGAGGDPTVSSARRIGD